MNKVTLNFTNEFDFDAQPKAKPLDQLLDSRHARFLLDDRQKESTNINIRIALRERNRKRREQRS